MKLFFAGAESAKYSDILYKLGVKNRLVSYYSLGLLNNHDKWEQQRADITRFDTVFMDCGAYSAWSKGFDIDVHDYARFLVKNGKDIDIYPNLDVKGSLEGTQRNMEILEDYGLRPIPVFHVATERWDVLQKYIDKYEYIALGAIAGEKVSKARLYNNLNEVFKRANRNPMTKFHGFGLTIVDILKKYPFYSADSTSWLSSVRYGGHVEFNGKSIKSKNTLYHKYMSKNRGYLHMAQEAAKSYIRLEKYLNTIWSERGITFDDSKYETKYQRRR